MLIKSNEIAVNGLGEVLLIRFIRPEIRSPLSVTVIDQLSDVFGSSLIDGFTTVVFTGTGSSFASGADLREIAEVANEAAPDFARMGQRLMQTIAELPQRTVAAVNGFCFGGALDLALACSARIASPAAMFAHPGTGLGIITGWGGTQRLPRLVGRANALEMFFTASPINAERAFSIGLVDLVAGDIFKNELLTIEASEFEAV
jgi:enoyl-CoA hydratase/carnithine racemase